MVQAGRSANPKIKFYPLMYFHSPWDEFMDRFGSIVDGVVMIEADECNSPGQLAVLEREKHPRRRRFVRAKDAVQVNVFRAELVE